MKSALYTIAEAFIAALEFLGWLAIILAAAIAIGSCVSYLRIHSRHSLEEMRLAMPARPSSNQPKDNINEM